jgi:hypothetical protein
VILYELFVGQPPFYTTSIYSLIHQIVQDSVKYPPEMSREFKSFLKVGHCSAHLLHRFTYCPCKLQDKTPSASVARYACAACRVS